MMVPKKEFAYECERCGRKHYRVTMPDGDVRMVPVACCEFDDMGGNDQ